MSLTITKTCFTCEHFQNDKHCIGCEWDESKRENTKWELEKNPIVIERAVLDKIRAEIDEQYDRVHPYDISCAGGLEMALEIIEKYMAEGREKECTKNI